jgi:iron complex transport system substrate-binding protein
MVLALCGYDIQRARRDYDLLRRFPGFSSIPAADSGQVYVVNANAYFARPGPRIVDSLEILAGNFACERISRVRFARARRSACSPDWLS